MCPVCTDTCTCSQCQRRRDSPNLKKMKSVEPEAPKFRLDNESIKEDEKDETNNKVTEEELEKILIAQDECLKALNEMQGFEKLRDRFIQASKDSEN